MYRQSTRLCPCLHVPVSRTQHAWLQGSIRTMEGMPRDSTLSPPTCALLLLRRSASCSCSCLPCLALPCLASPRTCHLPNSTCVPTRQAVRLSVWVLLQKRAICLPSLSVGTRCLSICQSTQTTGSHQLTRRPKVAKVGNGTTRFGLLFGRGTVSPRLPAVCTPSCSSPDLEMKDGCRRLLLEQ